MEFKLTKISLEAMVPAELRRLSDDELQVVWNRLNVWYNDSDVLEDQVAENFINAARFIMDELKSRELNFDIGSNLAQAARKLGKTLIEHQFNKLPGDVVVVKDFVNVVGSTISGSNNPRDLDVLIRAEVDQDNALIKCENIWVPIRNILNPEKQHDLQFIFNPQGAHGDYMPLYDLVLRRREQPAVEVVKGCKYSIDDFKRQQKFELEGDIFSDKGPATGVVLDVIDNKIIVEFDEPQTFNLDELQPYLEKTEGGWMVRAEKSQPTISDVHVPSALQPSKKPDDDEHKLQKGGDLESRGVYIRRNVLNADRLYQWAKEEGIPNLVPPEELHVTQVYSENNFPIRSLNNKVICDLDGGAICSLGDKGAVVLMFNDPELKERWNEACKLGASWEYEGGYKPHVTLSYDVSGMDLAKIKIPDLKLELGPEIKESLSKNEGGDDAQRPCFFCGCESSKIIIWGGKSNIMYSCTVHVADSIEHVMGNHREPINQIIDIDQEQDQKSKVDVEVAVRISKDLKDEGDISRESAGASFWKDHWDKLFPKDGKGRFVYQHHWRGLSEDEIEMSDKQLLDTSHSLHGDLRFEADGGLWGFSVFIGTAADNKGQGGDKLISVKDDRLRGNFKLEQPKEWLDVGVKKPYISEPGGVGATSQKYALFEALDSGTYEVGVRHRHFVEIFLKGDKLKGRYIISSVPVNGERAWMISKPEDQTPYAEAKDLEKEAATLKQRGHKELLWAKPGEKPRLVDLTKEITVKEYHVQLLKEADAEKKLIMGVVLEPNTIDAHNDTIHEDEIEKAAHEYMRKSRLIGLQHKKKAPVQVVESYIAPIDFEVGGQKVRKGSWIMLVKVLDDKVWKAIKRGEYTGFSIGGYGKRIAAT